MGPNDIDYLRGFWNIIDMKRKYRSNAESVCAPTAWHERGLTAVCAQYLIRLLMTLTITVLPVYNDISSLYRADEL